MKKLMNTLRRFKLVFRKSRPVTKIVALCAVVLSMVALLTLQGAILASREQTNTMLDQAGLLEQQILDLQQRLEDLKTEEGIRDIAEQDLGLVDPNTVIITPQQ